MVEVLKHFGGFFLAQIESVVYEAPAEVIDIQLTVAIIVHSSEDTGDSFQTASRSLQNLPFDLVNKVLNAELVEFFDGLAERSVRGRYDNEMVLIVLETGWNITGGVSSLLELQVLRLVLAAERVTHDFPFTAKFVSVAH